MSALRTDSSRRSRPAILSAKQDARQVITDVHACYFGAELDDRSLTPGDKHRIAPTRFDDWLRLDLHGART
jgi:hypothetical protein